MIHKDAKIGTIEGVTWVEMGTGDVLVSSSKSSDGLVGLILVQDIPREVSSKSNTEGKSTDETGLDVFISFSKIQSIDVVIRALERCKDIFYTDPDWMIQEPRETP